MSGFFFSHKNATYQVHSPLKRKHQALSVPWFSTQAKVKASSQGCSPTALQVLHAWPLGGTASRHQPRERRGCSSQKDPLFCSVPVCSVGSLCPLTSCPWQQALMFGPMSHIRDYKTAHTLRNGLKKGLFSKHRVKGICLSAWARWEHSTGQLCFPRLCSAPALVASLSPAFLLSSLHKHLQSQWHDCAR